jgi:chemotaxis protein MotB
MSIFNKKKKKQPEHDDPPHREEAHHAAPHDEEGWLVSYADMMTLLCGFFIMLFSMAKLDEPKYEKVKEAIAKEFGGEYKSPTQEMARFVTEILQEAGVEKETQVKSDPGGVSITFQSTLFFDTLSAEILTEGKNTIEKVIDALATRQKLNNVTYKVVVEGHTDGRPIVSGPFPSNWELSAARASRVVRLFLEKGYNPKQLTAIGYADTYPEKTERNPAGEFVEENMSKNRRVVIRILQPKVDYIPLPDSDNTGDRGAEAPAAAPAQSAAPAAAAPASSAH